MKKILALCFLMSFYAQASTLKLGVLAPEGSSWANSLKQMGKRIGEKTSGRVQFKIYYGGSQGDEGDVVKKIRIGQLHGGFFTGKTLGELQGDVRVMETPFTFGADTQKAMSALDAVEKKFGPGFDKLQLKCLGLYGLGFVYFISQKKFTDLESLKGTKIWTWDGEKLTTTMIDKLHFASVPLPVTDVLSSLSTGMLQATYAPPMGIVALQWNTKVKYLLDYPLAYSIGAFLVDKKEWNKLSAQDQKIVSDESSATLKKITKDNDRENAEALSAMKKMGIEFVRFSDKDIAKTKEIRSAVVNTLKGNFYSASALSFLDARAK